MTDDLYYPIPTDPLKPLLINGDSFQEIKMFKDCSIDSIVSDLPYLISFMGLKWDTKSESPHLDYIPFFRECIRVLKPGAKMAIFTGTLNYDLFVNWCRAAGFEILNMAGWVYTSGMPHGENIVKYLIKHDNMDTAEAWDVIDFKLDGLNYQITVCKDGKTEILKGEVPKIFQKFIKCKRSDKTSKDLLLSKLRYLHAKYFGYSVITYDVIENRTKYKALFRNRAREEMFLEGKWTDLMERVDGFNTALKPALEPIAILQKPLSEKTVIENIIRWGTGAYNIKDCMIPLPGMENLNIEQVIAELKRFTTGFDNQTVDNTVFDPKEGYEGSSIKGEEASKLIEETEKVLRQRKDTDITFKDTTIRDRMNSGGGNLIDKKAVDDISMVLNAGNRRNKTLDSGKGKEYTLNDTKRDGMSPAGAQGGLINKGVLKALDDLTKKGFGTDIEPVTENEITYNGTTVKDRMFSAGTSEFRVKQLIGSISKDLKGQVVGFNPMENKEYTLDESKKDSLKAHGNDKTEAIKEVLKFGKGSHEMYGSSGSGVLNYNTDGKQTKSDLDKVLSITEKRVKDINRQKTIQNTNVMDKDFINRNGNTDKETQIKNDLVLTNVLKATKEIARGTPLKASGSGTLGMNKDKDVSEDELHKIGVKSDTVGEMLKKELPFIKTGGQTSTRMDGKGGVLKLNKEDGILTEKEVKKLTDDLVRPPNRGTNKQKPDGIGIGNGVSVTESEFQELQKDLKSQTTRHDPLKHKEAIFDNAATPMDNQAFTLLTFFDKMLGRFPSNIMTTEKGMLGLEYDKIFLVPKPSPTEKLKGIPKELQEELHKTIKPRRLMKQLVLLLTPRGGVCLDAFAGSGTTIMECKANNIRAIGIELDQKYYELMKIRVKSIKASQSRLSRLM